MAKKQETQRNYRFTDAKLIQVADGVVLLIERDSEQMEDRGVDSERKAALVVLRNELSDTKPDQYYKATQAVATENKEAARARLITSLRRVFTAAENVFGARSLQYKQLGNASLTKLTDDGLVRNARNVVLMASNYLGDLRKEGVTEAKLAEITDLNMAFDLSVDEQLTAQRNRDLAAQDRIEKGNALYAELVKICNTGKDIWYETNLARYNDYVLYDTPTGKPDTKGQVSTN
jgi:hypothetical protein